MLSGIRHIFFDLDHTLWDYDRNAAECIAELIVEFQQEIGQTLAIEDFYGNYQFHNERLWTEYRHNRINLDHLRRQRWELAFDAHGVPAADWMEDLSIRFTELCPNKPHLIHGALDMLRTLRSHFQLHIITNGLLKTQTAKLAASGLSEFFDVLVTADLAGVKKPHPYIFELALQQANATKENAIYVGDNYDADVTGAQNAGMPVIFYNPELRENPARVPEVRQLHEILALL